MEQISSLFCFKSACLDSAIDQMSTVPMYVGVALAVAGVALTIIVGAHFTFAVGSAILGVVCVLGLYHARKSQLLTGLQAKIDSLEKVNVDLKATNLDLKQNISTFSTENKKLQKNIENTETENQKLQENNNKLDTELQNMASENVKLGAQISALTGTVENSKNTLKKFQKERKKLEASGITIDERTKNLLTKADEAFKEIKEELKHSKNLLETASTYFKEDLKESVEELNKNLKLTVSKNLQPIFKDISAQHKALGAVNAQLKEKTLILTKVTRELEEVETKLRTTQEEIANETKKLSEVVVKVENAADRHLNGEQSGHDLGSTLNQSITSFPVLSGQPITVQ